MTKNVWLPWMKQIWLRESKPQEKDTKYYRKNTSLDTAGQNRTTEHTKHKKATQVLLLPLQQTLKLSLSLTATTKSLTDSFYRLLQRTARKQRWLILQLPSPLGKDT